MKFKLPLTIQHFMIFSSNLSPFCLIYCDSTEQRKLNTSICSKYLSTKKVIAVHKDKELFFLQKSDLVFPILSYSNFVWDAFFSDLGA